MAVISLVIRHEISAVGPPQPTGEKAQQGQCRQMAGQAAGSTQAARKCRQRHRS